VKKKARNLVRWSVLTGAILAMWVGQPATQRRAADQVFRGRFITLDAAHPDARAIAVAAGRIVAIGSDADVAPFTGPSTTRVDLPGVAVPGLADAHVHPQGFGRQLESIDLHGLGKSDTLARVADAARRAPGREWIRGSGWDEGHWQPPEFPTAAELDRVTAGHPAILDRIDGHAIWVNSAALEISGVSSATRDPEGGRILRDSSGRPTGVLVDHATTLVTRSIPPPTPTESERQLRAVLRKYAAWGLTSIHDAGASGTTVALYRKLLASDELPLRVYVMVRGDSDFVAETLTRGPEVGLGDGRLTIRSIKVILDGALGSRGAQLTTPYADAASERGLETMTDAALRDLIRAAVSRGFQVNAHAIGDRAVARALDAFEASGPGLRDRRFRVEHASVIEPRDLPRFVTLGVIASMQPMFVGEYSRWADDRVGPARAPWVLPIRSMIDAGVTVPFGTDYPDSDSGDPVLNLFAAVTRRGWDGSPPGGWHTDQRVDVMTALRGLTVAPAFAAFQENDRGSLTVGQYADLTVLSEDPRTMPANALHDLRVQLTIVSGRTVFRAAR
jgi:predicted amidohydrolase YtcJ